MIKEYCHICGHKLEKREEYVWWCGVCKSTQYVNPKPASEVILHRDGKILISQRGIEPGKGKFDMPGGFIEINEVAEVAARRELAEELGIQEADYTNLRILRTHNTPYPFGNDLYRVLCIVFIAELLPGISVSPHDDVAALQWISQQEIPQIDWAHTAQRENALLAFELIA